MFSKLLSNDTKLLTEHFCNSCSFQAEKEKSNEGVTERFSIIEETARDEGKKTMKGASIRIRKIQREKGN